MRVRKREVGYGVVEERLYDDDDKLVEIRKIQPKNEVVQRTTLSSRRSGVFGGGNND